MKNKIALVALAALAIALSGCTQAPEASYKYVCSDGTIVDSPALCPPEPSFSCEDCCETYCQQGQEEEPETNPVEYVKSEMVKANYCELPDDCLETNTKCPLGCYNLVNKAELDRINGLVKEFKQTCYQTCAALADVNCIESVCQPIIFGVG